MTQSFRREERLKSKIAINQLYDSGKSIHVGFIRATWLKREMSKDYPVQLMISVSKRSFKRAVDRNKIKRRIREAYRKNKQGLYDFLKTKNKKIILSINFQGKEDMSYKDIENKIILTLQRLETEIEKAD